MFLTSMYTVILDSVWLSDLIVVMIGGRVMISINMLIHS